MKTKTIINDENRFCVYIHSRPDTGAVFYVGVGTIDRPYTKKNRNSEWKKIVSENGGKFTVDIFDQNIDAQTCREAEIDIIRLYGRLDKGTGTLCNKSNGGEAFHVLSDDEKQNLRLKNIKSNAVRYMERAPIIKIKNRGVFIQKILKKTGEVLDEYITISSASKHNNISTGHINEVLTGKRQRTGDFSWRRSDDAVIFNRLLADYIIEFDQNLMEKKKATASWECDG